MSTRKLPPPAPGSERRQHQRVDVLAQIDIKRGTDVWVVEVTNLSIGGLFIQLDTRQMIGVRPGDEVGVFLDLGNDAAGQPLALETRAEVVRVDYGGPDRPAGVGMMFTSSEAATATALARILRHLETAGGQR